MANAVTRRGVSTPAMLKRWMAGIVVLALLTAGGAVLAASAIGDVTRTIGTRAAPSVTLALQIEARLADMDASALADSLVEGGAATGTSWQFAEDEAAIADAMVTAAHLSGGDTDAPPLRRLQLALLNYKQAVVEARYLGQGNPWLATRRQQWASRVNRDFVMPAAQELQAANADVLEARYDAYRNSSLVYGIVVFAAFALLVALLVLAQLWLARRMRRLLNPLLVAATLLAVGGGLWFGTAVLAEWSELRTAKQDAYDSLHVLFQAKAAASALRADASLWLFDPSAQQNAEALIDADTNALIGQTLRGSENLTATLAALDAALADERQTLPDQAMMEAGHPDGLLGKELANITFGVAEREPATDAVRLLGQSARAVAAMQAQQTQGQHAQAIVRWLSGDSGGGAASFTALQAALDRTIAVNQAAFDRAINSALATVAHLPIVTTLALVLAALLAALGLMPRLREYR